MRFQPFVGIGPRRYFDLFSLSLGSGRVIRRKKKEARGAKESWTPGESWPRVPLSPLSYLERERLAAGLLAEVEGDERSS